jgi:hypothetical protein
VKRAGKAGSFTAYLMHVFRLRGGRQGGRSVGEACSSDPST